MLLEKLAAAGCAVQLKHEAEETSWDAHGRVRVLAADGTVLADEPKAQHNSQYSAIPATMERMADAAILALRSAGAASTVQALSSPKAGSKAAGN